MKGGHSLQSKKAALFMIGELLGVSG